MPLLTSEPISALAVELLRRSLVLVGTVSRVPGPEFAGPSGGVVTLRVPMPRIAREQVTPGDQITYAAIAETPVNVTLRHHYDASLVTDEDLSLNLADFGMQVLRPQVAAVAEAAEDQLAGILNALTLDAETEFALVADADDTRAAVLALRERLTINAVPAGGRYLAVAPDVATRILGVPEYVRVDESGSPSALRDATIGRLFGLTIVESNALDAGTAVAYHASGLVFGNRPPIPPGGGADSTTASDGGVSLRHVLAFDPGRLSTASVVSVFSGASVVPDDGTVRRAIRVGTAAV